MSGRPEAFASTMTDSGFQYLNCSRAFLRNSGNSYQRADGSETWEPISGNLGFRIYLDCENYTFDGCGVCGIEDEEILGGSVWPGNTNADSKVDVNDILPIGMYWNQVACDRSALAADMYKWESQPLSNDECLSHADANGDGKVDIADVLVIMVNWDKETSGGVVDESCIPSTEELSRYYSNFNQIYSTLIGESDEVVQMRNKLEALFIEILLFYKLMQKRWIKI